MLQNNSSLECQRQTLRQPYREIIFPVLIKEWTKRLEEITEESGRADHRCPIWPKRHSLRWEWMSVWLPRDFGVKVFSRFADNPYMEKSVSGSWYVKKKDEAVAVMGDGFSVVAVLPRKKTVVIHELKKPTSSQQPPNSSMFAEQFIQFLRTTLSLRLKVSR